MIRDAALRGKCVMVTQAGASGRVAEALERRGATVWRVPTIEIVPPVDWTHADAALRDWTAYDWAVFTSGNAVTAVAERLAVLGLAGASPHVKIAAVSGVTARLAQEMGWAVSLQPEEQTAEGLVAALTGRAALAGKTVLFPQGDLARDVAPEMLRAAGARVREAIVYRTVPAKLDAQAVRTRLRSGAVDAITFTSPSTAQFLVEALGTGIWDELPRSFLVASIGPTTSAALRELGRPPDVEAGEPSAEALADAVVKALDR